MINVIQYSLALFGKAMTLTDESEIESDWSLTKMFNCFY